MNYTKITLLWLLSLASPALRAQEKCDTLLKKRNVSEVTISESRGSVSVAVKGKDQNGEYSKEYSSVYPDNTTVHSSQWERGGYTRIYLGNDSANRHWRHEIIGNIGLHLGFMAAASKPEKMQLNTGRISDISLLNIISYRATLRNSPHAFSIGIGLTWRSYPLKNTQTFSVSEGVLGYSSYSGSSTLKRSRLKVFSLSFPALWHFTFANKHSLVVGPIVNINTHASVKTVVTNGNTDAEEYVSGSSIGRRIITVDAYGAINILGGVSAYVRYSPMNVLKEGRGPRLKPLSFGLAIGI